MFDDPLIREFIEYNVEVSKMLEKMKKDLNNFILAINENYFYLIFIESIFHDSTG